jgi:uncharacterized membrane protein YfcA
MSTQQPTIEPRQFVQNLLHLQYREVLMTFAATSVIAGTIVFFPRAENITKGIQTDLGITVLVLFVVVAIISAVVKGAIGFGYSLIATPIFVSVIDPTIAIVVLAIPPWMINVFQIGDTNTGFDYICDKWGLVVLAVAGSIVGVIFLARFSTGAIVPFLIGLLILGYAIFEVVKNFIVIERASHPVALSVVGFLEGFLLGAANLGPLLPAYLHTFERDTERYIGGLSLILLLIFTTRLVWMGLATPLLTPYRLWLGCAIAVITIVGLLLGTYLRRLEINETRFNWAVIVLLVLISLNIFRNTIPALFF